MTEMISILLSLTFFTYLVMVIVFSTKYIRYKYVGNKYIYIVISYFICLTFALFAKFNSPLEIGEENSVVLTASSFFEALKMLALAFDKEVLLPFFEAGNPYFAFGVGYVIASALGFIFTSITIVLTFIRSFTAKGKNFFGQLFNKRKPVTYIFSDSKNDEAIRLAKELRKDNIVKIVLTRASQKNQEGMEFKDALLGMGFDVKTQNFTKQYCDYVINRCFNPKHRKIFFVSKRKTTIFAMFQNDENALILANLFKSAIVDNRYFKRIQNINSDKITKDTLDRLEKFKIFVTYEDVDIDLNNHYSSKTLHIINTISKYEMISTEFILNNPITTFKNIDEFTNEDNQSMHITFLGFGKINSAIFEKMTHAYQLWNDNINKIHYHILDKDTNYKCTPLQSIYTSKVDSSDPYAPPFLYSVESECDGHDLAKYEPLNKYIASIIKNKDKYRFDVNGFEVYIISMSKTSTDIETSLLLRKALIQNVPKERLNKTIIYIRIDNTYIADSFYNSNKKIVLKQKDIMNGQFANGKINICVPIIIFGENIILSEYVNNHYHMIDYLGMLMKKSYDSYETIERSRREWLNESKDSTRSNIEIAYSAKTKLKILGYDVSYDYVVRKNDGTIVTKEDINNLFFNISVPNYDNLDCLSLPINKIAALEHNRWLVAVYHIYKYGQYNIDEFIKNNPALVKNDDNSFTSKIETKFELCKHVCMITNKGLWYLNNEIKRNFPNMKENADKLTFTNDINSIKDFLIYLVDYSSFLSSPTKKEKKK